MALASMMLAVLTGCPSVISNVVASSQSVQNAIDQADPGDTIKIMGTHDEDVTVDKANLTLKGQDGATIDGNVEVNGDSVAIENVDITGDVTVNGDNDSLRKLTIDGVLGTEPGSFTNLILNKVVVASWQPTPITTPTPVNVCTRVVQPNSSIQSAINNTSPGGTVCVAPGTYTQQVGFGIASNDNNTTLTSIASRASTTIRFTSNLGGPTVSINADGVTVDGFTVERDDQGDSDTALAFNISASDVTVENNRVVELDSGHDDDIGINVTGDSDITIQDNEAEHYTIGIGVATVESGTFVRDVIAKGNNVHQNQIGLAVFRTVNTPRNITASGNSFRNNDHGVVICGPAGGPTCTIFGLESGVTDASEVTVSKNNITSGVNTTTSAGIVNAGSGILNAEGNFFGAQANGPFDPVDTSAETGGTTASNGNCSNNPASESHQPGRGEKIAEPGDAVDYCPWATSSF